MGVTLREKPRGSGVWLVTIHQDGRRRAKKVGDRKKALAVKRELEAALSRGALHLTPRALTVAHLADEYQRTVPVLNHQARMTRANAEQMLRVHILPAWGTRRVSDLRHDD
jgi:hypothetical protein